MKHRMLCLNYRRIKIHSTLYIAIPISFCRTRPVLNVKFNLGSIEIEIEIFPFIADLYSHI